MPSLDDTFRALRRHLSEPEGLNPAKSDPFFYFVHEPAETLEVKRRITPWSAQLRHDGWTVEVESLSALLWKTVDDSGRWEEWLELEADAEPAELNKSIANVLASDRAFVDAVDRLVSTERPSKTVILLTDAVALHPYFRCRALESALHDRVKVPTVLFYPGRRSGQYGLHFLGFYPFDGNYRASLIGGIE